MGAACGMPAGRQARVMNQQAEIQEPGRGLLHSMSVMTEDRAPELPSGLLQVQVGEVTGLEQVCINVHESTPFCMIEFGDSTLVAKSTNTIPSNAGRGGRRSGSSMEPVVVEFDHTFSLAVTPEARAVHIAILWSDKMQLDDLLCAAIVKGADLLDQEEHDLDLPLRLGVAPGVETPRIRLALRYTKSERRQTGMVPGLPAGAQVAMVRRAFEMIAVTDIEVLPMISTSTSTQDPANNDEAACIALVEFASVSDLSRAVRRCQSGLIRLHEHPLRIVQCEQSIEEALEEREIALQAAENELFEQRAAAVNCGTADATQMALVQELRERQLQRRNQVKERIEGIAARRQQTLRREKHQQLLKRQHQSIVTKPSGQSVHLFGAIKAKSERVGTPNTDEYW